MSLRQQQDLLARLYTDAEFRRAFLSEPVKIGAENDLSETEIAEIAEIMPEELNFFAESLFRKRLREAEKFLPLTRSVLQDDFTKYFREFSQNFNPQTVKKHFEDALGFCDFLQKHQMPQGFVKDAAKFERAKLVFSSRMTNLCFEKFDFDIREIQKSLAEKKSVSEPDFSERKTFAIWLRIGKMTRLYIF